MRRNAPSSLEDAAAQLRRGMGAARRGRHSLPELRDRERGILKEWFVDQGRIFQEDPTLNLERCQSHGEHRVGYHHDTDCWWKTTHPGKCGIGAEFHYGDLPPFELQGVSARELLPSEYLDRLLLFNCEFGDDIRIEGFLEADLPSLVISQPDIVGLPATAEQMKDEMMVSGYKALADVQLGKAGSISFYNPETRIALFDAHPGNFFHAEGITLPIDGIILQISSDSEHQWLAERAIDTSTA